MTVKNVMTADFLRQAYGGESMAHMRYLIWGDAAQRDGYTNIGILFKAIAYAERVHAENHFRVLKDLKSDHTVPAGAVFGLTNIMENLQGALNGELHEINQMYPVYLEAARFQNEKDAERSFHYALEAEKMHADLFERAQDAVMHKEDINLESVYVCPICGYTVGNDAPDVCPICGAKKEKFHEFA